APAFGVTGDVWRDASFPAGVDEVLRVITCVGSQRLAPLAGQAVQHFAGRVTLTVTIGLTGFGIDHQTMAAELLLHSDQGCQYTVTTRMDSSSPYLSKLR